MSYIKFEARHLEDERWLDADGNAFTLHAWALSYCNEACTDGLISTRMAKRVALPLDPDDFPAAVKVLTELGLWVVEGDAYRIVDFLAHGLPADEQAKTRTKWAEDKRRQRLHRNGNHSMCTERWCPAAGSGLSTRGQVEVSTDDKWTTRSDPTRPDPTRPDPSGGDRRRGTAAAGDAAGSAARPDAENRDAPRAPRTPPSVEFSNALAERRQAQATAAEEQEQKRREAEADYAARLAAGQVVVTDLTPEQVEAERREAEQRRRANNEETDQ